MIIDFHVHCFADSIAGKAIALLEDKSGLTTVHDGTVGAHKRYMQSCGVDKSVVLPVATKPSQVNTINDWAKKTRDDELYFFGALHPDDEDFCSVIRRLKADGFAGVKLHPDYQHFYADEKRMMPVYEALRDEGLMLSMHCGLDNVYPVPVHCTPFMVKNILDNIKGLKLIVTHMGGHALWRDAEELIIGMPVYIDTCYSQYALGKDGMERLIKKHGADYVLFGTDSPWKRADEEIRMLAALDLPPGDLDKILYINALRLLDQ